VKIVSFDVQVVKHEVDLRIIRLRVASGRGTDEGIGVALLACEGHL
jgi:hypothetical protein